MTARCPHIEEDYAILYDDGGSPECLDTVLGCGLISLAAVVLRGYAIFGDPIETPTGLQLELLWDEPEAKPYALPVPLFDEGIPF